MENNSMMIDLKALVDFFKAHEGRYDSYDISTADELRAFLADFCLHELWCNAEKKEETLVYTDTSLEVGFQMLDIYFPDKEHADLVLEMLKKEYRHSGYVTVADYFAFAGKKPEPWTYQWGWYALEGAFVYCYSDRGVPRHAIHLPKPERRILT